MLVLGLETATAQSGVCLATEEGLVAEAALGAPPRGRGGRGPAHGEFLHPAVEFCLAQARVDVGALSGVAVDLGPGLYTGMRVGIAAAQALAHVRQLPVVGLPSLDVLAFGARHAPGLVASVLDARRGELFWALYRADGGPRRLTEMQVGPSTRLAGQLETQHEPVVCVGDGALAHREELEATGATVDASPAGARPDARGLVELALPRFLRADTQRPEDLRPLYLRQADARINWRSRGALYGGEGGAHPSGRASAEGERTTHPPRRPPGETVGR